jgi:hypothetical protein
MRTAIISIIGLLVLVLIGGGGFLYQQNLSEEPLNVNVTLNINAGGVENVNTAAENENVNAGETITDASENVNAATNTNTAEVVESPILFPNDYPPDLYQPADAALTAVDHTGDKTTVSFESNAGTTGSLSPLRDFMTNRDWVEHYEVSASGYQYDGTWTKSERSVSVSLLYIEAQDMVLLEITY